MKRKLVSIITVLAMCTTVVPSPIWAAESGVVANQENGAIEASGEIVKIGAVGADPVSVFVPKTAGTLAPQENEVTEVVDSKDAVTWTKGWYIVRDPAVEISQRINVKGTVNLILADGANLSAIKGITVEGSNSLTIWGQKQGSGKLNVGMAGTTLSEAAGIGSTNANVAGDIIVNGGDIKVKGGYYAAGIGGGRNQNAGHTTINHGQVTVDGGADSAGIGGGKSGAGGEITINGGIAQATGGSGSAGIGGGRQNSCGRISITNGRIKATGGTGGAGIGSGVAYISGGTICISGGYVEATGGKFGSGIGKSSGGSNLQIELTGGIITVTGGSGERNKMPGNGIDIGQQGSVTVNGAIIFAKAVGAAKAISENLNKNAWSGVIFEKNQSDAKYIGKIYGDPTIATDVTFSDDKQLTINENQTLTVADGVTVTNNGTLTNNGTIRRATPANVTFQIEHGTFGTVADTEKTVQVPLVTAQGALTDALQFAGTLKTEDIPKNMKPAAGYGMGQWDPTPNTTANAVTKNISYKYTCVALPKQNTPNIHIDYKNETLTGFSTSAIYELTVGEESTEVKNTEIQPVADYIGKTINIVQKGDAAHVDSDAQILEVKARPAVPTDLSAMAPSFVDTQDGHITGLVADTTYEYRVKDGTDWQPLTEATNLAAGTYEVRIKASTEAFASSAVDVEVPTGQVHTYTIGVTAPSFTAVQYGDAQPAAQPITITSSGNTATTLQSVTVSSEDFIIAGNGSTVSAGAAIKSRTVQPKAALAVGTHTATITVTTEDGQTVTAPVKIVVNKGDQAAPAAPVVKSKSSHSIILEAMATNGKGTEVEYSKDGGATWQADSTFTELEASTEYTIVARYKANAQYNASPASAAIKVHTDAIPVNPGATDKTETITHPDGAVTTVVTKPNKTVISTTKHPNGDVTKETKRPDGSGEVTMQQANGSQSMTTIDQAGQQKTTVQLSAKAVAQAQQEQRCVAMPMPAPAPNAQHPAQLHVALPAGTSAPVAVYLPVQGVSNTTVLMVRQADGSTAPVCKAVNDDKGITTVLTGALDCTIVDNAQTFIDTENHWGAPDIGFVTSRTIFNGVGGQRFAPDAVTNRAMLVTVLHNLENHPQTDAGHAFEDVADDAWYTEAVQWAAEKGIVSGVDASHFAPEDNLSREQMAVMLYRYAGSPAVEADALAGYSDAKQVQPWAKDAMSWAVSNGIITGIGDNQLAPQGEATRAQLAAIVHRMLVQALQ